MRDYRNIFNKVVPYHTDNSMSLYEFVGRLYEYIKDFEGTLDEAHEKIDEFVQQFGTELNNTTKDLLTEWHDDGTLAELINLVWDDKAEKYYVDNLINQIANTLTDNYTQADDSLRDQVNANVSAVETALDNKITEVETKANRTSVSFGTPSLLEWALQKDRGLHYFITDSATADVPADFMYSTGILMVRNETHRSVVIVSYSTGQIISNTHLGGEWKGWKDAMGVELSAS